MGTEANLSRGEDGSLTCGIRIPSVPFVERLRPWLARASIGVTSSEEPVPFIEFVMAVPPNVASGGVTSLLRNLLAAQREQAQRLAGLRADVRDLLERPWRRAQTAMECAIGAGGARRRQLLETVAVALREAHSYEKEPSAERAAVAAVAAGAVDEDARIDVLVCGRRSARRPRSPARRPKLTQSLTRSPATSVETASSSPHRSTSL